MGFNGFFYIGSLGHCGTKWLATVLNRPSHGIACYYEMKAELEKELIPVERLVEQENYFPVPNSYLVFFQEMSRLLMVGDAHSWPAYRIGYVLKSLQAQKAIWLVRNGVQAVQSFDTWLDALYEKDAPGYARFIDQMGADVKHIGTPVPISDTWDALSQFQQICWWWSTNALADDSINEIWQGPVTMVRFEDLLAGDLLPVLVQWINPLTPVNRDELRGWASVFINRHNVSSHPPDVVWKRWGSDKKGVFEGVCGSTMERLGYRYG